MRDDDWAERVRALTPIVVRRIRGGSVDDVEAHDACQHAWLELLRRPGTLRDESCLAAWLTTTARRHAHHAIGRRTREPSPLPMVPGPSPETVAMVAERDRALWRAVDALPSRHRRLLHLVAHRPELSVAEIAAELGISPASVGSLRRRSCARVRRRLAADGFGDPGVQ